MPRISSCSSPKGQTIETLSSATSSESRSYGSLEDGIWSFDPTVLTGRKIQTAPTLGGEALLELAQKKDRKAHDEALRKIEDALAGIYDLKQEAQWTEFLRVLKIIPKELKKYPDIGLELFSVLCFQLNILSQVRRKRYMRPAEAEILELVRCAEALPMELVHLADAPRAVSSLLRVFELPLRLQKAGDAPLSKALAHRILNYAVSQTAGIPWAAYNKLDEFIYALSFRRPEKDPLLDQLYETLVEIRARTGELAISVKKA